MSHYFSLQNAGLSAEFSFVHDNKKGKELPRTHLSYCVSLRLGQLTMKKNYLKSLTFLAFCLSLFAALTVCASAKTVKSGNYIFDVNGKTASLVEYTGSESTVSVPSKVGTATVTKINDYAFWQNKKAAKVYLPSTVTTIGDAVFNECTALYKVVLPKKLVTMGDSVFWYCTNLKTVVFYENAKTFGKNIFTGCNKAVTAYVVKGSPAEKYIKTQKSVALGYRYVSSLKAPSSLRLVIGAANKISATVSPAVVYDRRVAYSSSDAKVVSVAADGTVKALKVGTATITCKALDGSGKSTKTTVTVVPAKTTVTRQSKTTLRSYRLEWTKAAGATAYRVFRYDAKVKKWVTLGDTTKNYYDLKNLAYYSADSYRVRAYSRIGKTTYGADISATFVAKVNYAAKVTGMTRGTSTADKVSFTWKAAAYADGYNVYAYDFGAKRYTLLTSTTALSYTAAKLTANTEYGFAVRAYSLDGTRKVLAKEHSGLFVISTAPALVTGLRVQDDSIGFEKLAVAWNKTENVTGYILAYSSAGESTKAIKLSAGQTSAELSELLPGVSYNVFVRAYTIRRSVAYYGAWTSVTVETAFMPTTPGQALTSFVKVFNTTRSTDKPVTLVLKQNVTSDINNPHTVNAEKVAAAVTSQFSASTQYNMIHAADEKSGVTLSALMQPSASVLKLTAEDLDPEKVSIGSENKGYRVGFVLEDQTAETEPEKLLAPTIDTEKIETETGLDVVSVHFNKTQVSEKYTKIRNGLFDNLGITAAFTVIVNDGESDIPLIFEVERIFYFLWV